MKFELDLDKFTLNGKAIMGEDIALLISRYSHKHPKDKLFRHLVEEIVGNNYTQKYKRE